MVDLTRHPRQIVVPGVDFEWDSSNSRIWQLFRVYEYYFGRRKGIKWEGGIRNDKWVSGTWENLLTAFEYQVRGMFKGIVPQFEIVRLPQLALANGDTTPLPFRFAIAFVTSPNAVGTGGPITMSVTISGSNPYLFAADAFSGNGSDITGTYNSVAMSATTGFIWIGSSNPMNALYLAGPTAGTHDIVTSSNASGLVANAYSGCDQGAIITDAHNVTTGTTDITLTINEATANCWVVVFVTGTNGTITAGTLLTVRTNNGGVGSSTPASLDSNANVATGSNTYHATSSTNQTYGILGIKFKEATAATVNSGFLMFM